MSANAEPQVEQRFGILLEDTDLARALIAAGLDTPQKVMAASDDVLLKLLGGGKKRLQFIRQRIG